MNINIKDNILTENNINQNGKDGENNCQKIINMTILRKIQIN